MPEQTNKPDPLAQAVDLCCHYIAENRSLTERLNDAERRLAEIGIKDPETHTEVAALVAALHLFCPGTYVTRAAPVPSPPGSSRYASRWREVRTSSSVKRSTAGMASRSERTSPLRDCL